MQDADVEVEDCPGIVLGDQDREEPDDAEDASHNSREGRSGRGAAVRWTG
jgi:hypothetical protein